MEAASPCGQKTVLAQCDGAGAEHRMMSSKRSVSGAHVCVSREWCSSRGKRVELVDLWYTASFGFSSKKVWVEEGFSPSRVISRQKGSPHLIRLHRKSPFALNRSLHANPASSTSSSTPKNWVSFITRDYILPLKGSNDGHQPTNGLFFPIAFCWSRGWTGYLYSLGKRDLQSTAGEGFQGASREISANVPHCRLAQWFKQLRVIFPQQTAVNAHCQYVQINISGETDKDIMVHVSSQIHCVLFPSFFFLFLNTLA